MRRSGIPGPWWICGSRVAFAAALALAFSAVPATAGTVSVAVAANFTEPAEEIARAFARETGHEARLSFGATGGLYAQITQGAPFAILLAADADRPALAVESGFGIAGTVFTYAIGRLAAYSPTLDVSDGVATLSAGNFSHVAIADPETAPYGAAALEALAALGLADRLAPKLVVGQSVAQALQFVESGNAEIGMVAASQVLGVQPSQAWLVPSELHAPIRQDAVLLKPGDGDPAAESFLGFLGSETARKIIESYGYDVPD